MMHQSVARVRSAPVYDDVERAILEQEAADPDWHFGFSANLPQRDVAMTPEAMAVCIRAGMLAQAQSFAGRMLRRWLRTHDDLRAQFWRDVASALARMEAE